MKIVLFFILIFSLFHYQSTYAFENYNSYWRSDNASHTTHNNDTLSYLENSIYGKNYPYDSTSSRIKKLENTLFGRTYDGLYTNRISNLYNYYFKTKQNNFRQNIHANTKRNLKRLSRALFGGVPTGFTPPIMNNMTNQANNPYALNTTNYSIERVYCDIRGNCTPYYEGFNSQMGVKIIRD